MTKKQTADKRRMPANVTAIYKRGIELYLQNNDVDAGLAYLFRAARAGYVKAYGELGIILYREKSDTENAEAWLRRAEDAGALSPEAAYEYGRVHYYERKDWKTGLEYLLQAAEQGYELAYGEIGFILYLERLDISEAEKWFRRAEEAGYLLPPNAYYYGHLLSFEKGEWDRSWKYLEQAARGGYEMAYGELGSFYYLERHDIDEAEKWFKKAEEADCLLAPNAYEYGMFLIEERDDVERGQRYLDKAAEDGY